MASKWISYNELAWTDDLFADPLEYEEEAENYVKIINDASRLRYSEHTIAGLFSEKTWDKLFKNADFKMNKVQLDGTYDNYILEDGAYSVVVFAGRKNSKIKN